MVSFKNERPGFYVWNPQAGPPRVRHDDALSAKAEANRLAARNPGQTFIVLATVGASCLPAPKPQWLDLLPETEVPF